MAAPAGTAGCRFSPNLPTATASSSTTEEAQGKELVNSGREIRCLKLPGINTPHCGHSAAPPHGKIPVIAVEIPGLKAALGRGMGL